MSRKSGASSHTPPLLTIMAFGFLVASASNPAKADIGGMGFWLPGLMGSLAAVPGQPGWGLANIYIHLDTGARGGKEFHNSGSVVSGLHARADALAIAPSYTFATPVLGGQAAVSLIGVPLNVGVNIDATLTGPRGNQISGHAADRRAGFADLFYEATLKWNHGVDNFMVYVTGNIPNGTFDAARLANISLGYTAVDGGIGYTYFDTKTGREFSIVGGLTYNTINPDLQYQNGIDSHIDWAASQFLSKDTLVGIAGYFFQQLTGDSGAGAKLGPFRGRVLGIGPQIGFIFPAGEGYQGYLNVKGYKDFATENRPEGWTAWVTLAFSPAEEKKPTEPMRPRVVK